MTIARQDAARFAAAAVCSGKMTEEIIIDLTEAGLERAAAHQLVEELIELRRRDGCSSLSGDELLRAWQVSRLSLDEAASASELTDQIQATPPEKYGYEDHFRALQPLQPITLSLGEAAYGIEVAEEELRAFVGTNAQSYVGDWISVLEGRKKRPAFNAVAFLFAGLWLPYRKLYGAAAVFLGSILVVNLLEMVVEMTTQHSPAQQTVIASLGWGVAIVGWFICGFFANQWYLSRAIRVINDVRSRHLDEDEHLEQIAKRGGTSIGSSLGIFVGFIVLNFALAFVAEMIAAPMALGQKVMFNGGELYYTSSVSEPEARKVGEHLVKTRFFDGSPKSVQITRSNGTHQFRMVVIKGMQTNPQFVQTATQFGKELSRDVFGGELVEVHLCDEYFNTLKVVKSK
jgi:hypothetical protein